MKKVSIILALAAVLMFATAASAFANFGPHGGYALDTDACAGCHRAHTSFSDLTWEDAGGNDHSALLISDASTMEEFCYACHGDNAPGAATNVVTGIFDSGPIGSTGLATNSTFNGGLNGGAFAGVSSMHDMEKGALTDPMWGAGNTAPAGTNLSCTSCHDPHGSSNYRILKDSVNGVTVGGYAVDGVTPQPYVFSSEEGYPAGGWLKHDAGASQMTTYYPNYTNAEYQYAGTAVYSGTTIRSISTWCSACHQQYDNKTSAYDYLGYEADGATRTAAGLAPGAGAAVGMRTRHRHPVDTTIAGVTTANGWGTESITSTALPLEKRLGAPAAERGTWERNDFMGCLTCHRAHGSAVTMDGWAVSSLANNASAVVTWYPVMATSAVPSGVNPNFSSALLRTDNRGVCERCHNK